MHNNRGGYTKEEGGLQYAIIQGILERQLVNIIPSIITKCSSKHWKHRERTTDIAQGLSHYVCIIL